VSPIPLSISYLSLSLSTLAAPFFAAGALFLAAVATARIFLAAGGAALPALVTALALAGAAAALGAIFLAGAALALDSPVAAFFLAGAAAGAGCAALKPLGSLNVPFFSWGREREDRERGGYVERERGDERKRRQRGAALPHRTPPRPFSLLSPLSSLVSPLPYRHVLHLAVLDQLGQGLHDPLVEAERLVPVGVGLLLRGGGGKREGEKR